MQVVDISRGEIVGEHPKLIVLDGLDGVGKTTTSAELKKQLFRLGFSVVVKSFEKDYFKDAFQEARVSNDPDVKYFLQLAALSLMSYEISQYPDHVIIISDRYIYSVNAYYSSLPEIERGANAVELQLVQPMISVLLECSDDVRKERLIKREQILSPRKWRAVAELGPKMRNIIRQYSFYSIIETDVISVAECATIILDAIFDLHTISNGNEQKI